MGTVPVTMTLGQILNILEIAGPLWALFLWIMRPRKPKPEPPENPVTASQVAMLKELGKPPAPPEKRGWWKSRPGWFGPTPNERLLAAIGMGYSEVIKAATAPPEMTPQQKISLARQAFAQDAELERVIENAIKDGA